MKVSVCITTFNEKEENIKKLLDALNNQTLKPDEIILVDAKDYNNCSRSEGRNIAIKKARNETIAVTDVGCIPHKSWLYELTKQFNNKNVDVVAGSYKMISKTSFQKSCSIFLGVETKNIKEDFMPSARSMAFKKSIWQKAGGFPEDLKNTAEDTVFNINLVKAGAQLKVSRNAFVDWYMTETIFEFAKKIFNYAKGDVQSGVWWHPIKKLKTHNIKMLSIFLRYILFVLFPILIPFYLLYSFIKASWWGVVLQITSDFAVMTAFVSSIIESSYGLLQRSTKGH